MKKAGSYILLGMLHVFSWLPLFMLYALSDVLFVILYRIVGYRRKVALENLKNAFPEKTMSEIKQLERKSYRFLCDLIVETLKIPAISSQSIAKRCMLKDTAVLDYFTNKKQAFIVVMGHHGNWEWLNLAVSIMRTHRMYAVYRPLKDPVFNRFILKTRGKWGTTLIPMKQTYEYMKKASGELSITGFITDQAPPPRKAHWLTFFHQPTPVFMGAEKLAKKYNLPVVFVDIKRVKRGYYKVESEIVTETPSALKEFELTEAYTARLEEEIRKQPETWLWTHRRWKHRLPEK